MKIEAIVTAPPYAPYLDEVAADVPSAVARALAAKAAKEAVSIGVEANAVDLLEHLVAEMKAGSVEVLVVMGANPVYAAPADLGFAEALAKVETTLDRGPYRDERARAR